MTDDQAKRLVAACQRMLRNVVWVRGYGRVEPEDIQAVEIVMDELPLAYVQECEVVG